MNRYLFIKALSPNGSPINNGQFNENTPIGSVLEVTKSTDNTYYALNKNGAFLLYSSELKESFRKLP